MKLGDGLRQRARIMLAPAIFLSITAYFAWSATQGGRGLRAYAQRQELLKQVRADEAFAKAERDAWAVRVAGLQTRHLNPDTLGERTRLMKNFSEPTDIIVKFTGQEKLF